MRLLERETERHRYHLNKQINVGLRLLCGGFFFSNFQQISFLGFFFASDSFSQVQTLCSNPCWLLCLTARQSALRCLYGICLLLSHCVPAESMRSLAARSEHQQGGPRAEPDCGNVFYIRGRLRSSPLPAIKFPANNGLFISRHI